MRIRSMRTLLASAALASASLFVSTPAQALDTRCRPAIGAWCTAYWQAAGYTFWGHCFDVLENSICFYPNYSDPNWPYLPPAPTP